MDINPVLFPAVTNRESWSQIIGFYDDDTGDALDLTPYTFACEVRLRDRRSQFDQSGYTPNYDYGGVTDYGPLVTLALGSGITVVATGQLELDITVDQMRTLCAGTYLISLVLSDGTPTGSRQIFRGYLPVLFGGVT